MEHRLVDTPTAFAAAMAEVSDAPLVALDTEAASFHRYHDRVYLLQLSTPTANFVIDPLGATDLAPIGALLADPDREKIFHDADYDLRLMDRQFGFRARRLFDTRIAAQFLNEPGIGLAALLEKYFQVKADKRFQRADWSARPLTPEMLRYAADDTGYLCELRSLLLTKLEEIGRADWVAEEFVLLEKTRWTVPEVDPDRTYLGLKGAKALERRSLAILRELYLWRETTAAALDRAAFRVMGNEALFLLAAHPVPTEGELAKVRGVGREAVARWGGEILAAIERGLAVPDDQLPRIERPERRAFDPAFAERVERLKKLRNTLAPQLELAPGVLCPNGTLENIAREMPQDAASLGRVAGVRRWQVRAIGEALIEAAKEPSRP